MDTKMFCFQCQETTDGVACRDTGLCGKKPEIAAMLDVLVYATKGLAGAHTAAAAG